MSSDDGKAHKKEMISCTIIVHNEEDRILRCLRSVAAVAAEIIVVDSDSTDSTMEICRQFGAVCYNNTWSGYGQQKRFAESKARHDWILNLDADEWLPDAIQQELLAIQHAPMDETIHGYEMTISQVYPGQDQPRWLADSHHYIRLYNKKYCGFPVSAVFDEVKLPKQNMSRLKQPVYHQSIRTIEHLIQKNVKYYEMQKPEVKMYWPTTVLRMTIEPLNVFFKYYILKRHITGGFYGLKVASTIAALRTYRLVVLLRK